MKTLGMIFCLIISTTAFATTQNECPNLDGDYNIEQYNKNLKVTRIGDTYTFLAQGKGNSKTEIWKINSDSSNTKVVPGAPEKIYCKDQRLVKESAGFGIQMRWTYELTDEDHLVLTFDSNSEVHTVINMERVK
jgi:hypothetical protein